MGYENAYEQDLKVLMPELKNHPHITDACYTITNANLFTEQGNWYGTYVTLCFRILPIRTQKGKTGSWSLAKIFFLSSS